MQSVDQNVAHGKSQKFSVGGASFLAVPILFSMVVTSKTWLEWILAGAVGLTWLVMIVYLARRQKHLPGARWGLALKLLFGLVLALLCASAITHFTQK